MAVVLDAGQRQHSIMQRLQVGPLHTRWVGGRGWESGVSGSASTRSCRTSRSVNLQQIRVGWVGRWVGRRRHQIPPPHSSSAQRPMHPRQSPHPSPTTPVASPLLAVYPPAHHPPHSKPSWDAHTWSGAQCAPCSSLPCLPRPTSTSPSSTHPPGAQCAPCHTPGSTAARRTPSEYLRYRRQAGGQQQGMQGERDLWCGGGGGGRAERRAA